MSNNNNNGHNNNLNNDCIPIGAHVVTPRTGYTHHGIYIGNQTVIHYSGFANGLNSGIITEVTLCEFANNRGYRIKRHNNPEFSTEEVVCRARSRIGEDCYNLFSNNCEHFCEWCINGSHDSTQIDVVTVMGSAKLVKNIGLAARGIVASSGVVTGLSGSGVMSGLAATGGIVGGGAVAGIGIIGTVPGIAMASLVNKTVLKDNEALEPCERNSRAVSRAASYVGVAAGTAGSIGAVSAAGSVAGLSATGITSGLAAIGGTVGGGMATGVAITAVAPVAAAAAVGYGVYKLVKWLKK